MLTKHALLAWGSDALLAWSAGIALLAWGSPCRPWVRRDRVSLGDTLLAWGGRLALLAWSFALC